MHDWDRNRQGIINPPCVCVNPHRLLDLQTFAAEAREAGAVVLNALHAEVGDNGFLQAFLEQREVQVVHTGSDSQVTALCHDKVCTAQPGQHLASWWRQQLGVCSCRTRAAKAALER